MAGIKGIVIGGSSKFNTGDVDVELPTGLGLLVVRQGAARVSVHLTDEALALLAKGALAGNRAALVTKVLAPVVPAAPAKVVDHTKVNPTPPAGKEERCAARATYGSKGRCTLPAGHKERHSYGK